MILINAHLGREARQNKGSILKASVEYIKKLQRDMHKMKVQEAKQKQLEESNRQMRLRIQVCLALLGLSYTYMCIYTLVVLHLVSFSTCKFSSQLFTAHELVL